MKPLIAVKSASERRVHAVIATLDQPDADRDVIRAGFFGHRPLESLVVPAHQWTSPPLGKAVTFERGPEVHALLTFNETPGALAWYEAIAHDFRTGSRPLQQYSWGFKAHRDAQTRTKSGRELHARPDGSPGIDLIEVSPVLRGASVNTRTVSVKSAEHAYLRALEDRLRKERRWR